MIEVDGLWVSYTDAARIRLAGWGSSMRYLAHAGGPAKNPYSQQAFMAVRVDCDHLYEQMQSFARLDTAMETDEWMNRIKDVAPKHYIAAVIAYVLHPHKHQREERLLEWKKETGLKGQTRFYECLRAVEVDVAMQVRASEKAKACA